MPDAKDLLDRIRELEHRVAEIRNARDGRDGRDGMDAEPGAPGERGERGERGPAGPVAEVDLKKVVLEMWPQVERELKQIPEPRDGVAGKDVTPEMVDRAVAERLAANPPATGERGTAGERGERGLRGSTGPRGPAGPEGPIGPMPRHEWDGTRLRFEQPDGSWGDWVDLKGRAGRNGGGGGGSATPSDTPVNVRFNSYFPSGW